MTYLGSSGFQIGNGMGTASQPVGDSGVRSCTVFNCSGASYGGVSSSGTTDTTGTATRATDTISGSDVNGPAFATVSANLADGTLHASAAGSFGHVYNGEDQFSKGTAAGVIYDGLHFTVAGASSTTVTAIQLEYHIDGVETSTRFAPYGYQAGYTAYIVALGNTVVRDEFTWTPGLPARSRPRPMPVSRSIPVTAI